ncbi:MAG: T9SS type A sorting domain-containing protein [Bacteroidales bacterium]|nr:T9SS type A sorting domain-containing protein [Bacteroidales bacterium]
MPELIFSQTSFKVEFTEPPELIVSAGDDLTIEYGNSVQLNAFAEGGVGEYTFSWDPEISIDNPLCENPIVRPNNSLSYYVTVTDVTGCSITDAVYINVLNGTGLGSDYNGVTYQVYPNPGDGKINLVFFIEELDIHSVEIIDLAGNMVYTEQVPINQQSINLNISHLKSGYYLLKLCSSSFTSFKKILIQ